MASGHAIHERDECPIRDRLHRWSGDLLDGAGPVRCHLRLLGAVEHRGSGRWPRRLPRSRISGVRGLSRGGCEARGCRGDPLGALAIVGRPGLRRVLLRPRARHRRPHRRWRGGPGCARRLHDGGHCLRVAVVAAAVTWCSVTA